MATATVKDDPAKAGTMRIVDPATGRVVVLPLTKAPDGTPSEVTVQFLGAFPQKQVIGPITSSSHEWLSLLGQKTWMGGGQVTDSQEATDIERYAGVSTIETRYANGVTLMPEAVSVPGTVATTAMVLGDLQQTFGGDVKGYVSYGTDLHEIVPTTWPPTVTDTGLNLNTIPVTNGVAFKGTANAVRKLFIPLGSTGYQIWDPSGPTLSALLTTVKPLNFVVWDNKIWCLTTDGTVYANATGADGGWVLKVTLESEGDPRRLLKFVDQFGAPALFAVTSREVQALSTADGSAYETSATYAPHPHAATASEQWREAIWYSHGIDTGRYDGGTVTYPGLASRDGIPQEYRGHVTSYAKGWNDLFTLIEGEASAGWTGDEFALDPDDAMAFTRTSSYSLLMRLDSLGAWHTVWASGSSGKETTNAYVSAAGGAYTLFWGFGGNVWASMLDPSFANPLENPTARFAPSGRLTSSWFDGALEGIEKILAAVEVGHERCQNDADTGSIQSITVAYQIDSEENDWVTLGTIEESPGDHEGGKTQFRIGRRDVDGAATLPDGTVWYEGAAFGRVRYRVDLATNDATLSPRLRSVVLVFMPKMGTLKAFTVRIDCSSEEHKTQFGLGNLGRRAFLEGLVDEMFVPVNFFGDEWHVVKVSGVGGARATGQQTTGDVEVSMVETFAP